MLCIIHINSESEKGGIPNEPPQQHARTTYAIRNLFHTRHHRIK